MKMLKHITDNIEISSDEENSDEENFTNVFFTNVFFFFKGVILKVSCFWEQFWKYLF